MTPIPARNGAPNGTALYLTPIARFGMLLAFLAVASSQLISLEVVDDAAVGAGRTTFYRLAPVVFVFASLPFLIFGVLDRRTIARPILAALSLALLICVGSLLYSMRSATGTQGTFMSVGICLFAALPGAMIGFNPKVRTAFAKPLVILSAVTGTFALAVMILHTMGLVLPEFQQVYRTDIIVLLAGPAYIIMRKRWHFAALILPLLLVYHGYSLGKSTSYMLAVAWLGIYFFRVLANFVIRLLANQSASRRFAMIALLSPVFLAAGGFVLSLFYLVATERINRDRYDVRAIALEHRWDQFLDSPIFGQGFVMSANMAKVMGFGKFVPSHNDIADLLAGGGLVAIILFAMALIPALANREVFTQLMGRSKVFSVSMYFWCNLVFYVAGATGNPLLNRPNYAVIVWFSVGYMLSYSRSVALAQQSAARQVVSNRPNAANLAGAPRPARRLVH